MKLNLCVSQWTIFIADLKKYDRIYAYRKNIYLLHLGIGSTSNKNTTRQNLYWLVLIWYTLHTAMLSWNIAQQMVYDGSQIWGKINHVYLHFSNMIIMS